MFYRFIVVSMLMASIVAFHFEEANAQKTTSPPPASKTTVASPQKETQKPSSQASSEKKKAATTPSEKKQADTPSAEKKETPVKKEEVQKAAEAPKAPLPILMELGSARNTYRAKQDIMIKAELWAIQPVTICLHPNRPEANFAVDLYRAGYGKIEVPPAVVQLSPQDLAHVERITLQPGESHRLLFNLKKLIPMPPAFWKTGEYRVQAKFFLCGRTEQAEMEIPSRGPLHLLILE